MSNVSELNIDSSISEVQRQAERLEASEETNRFLDFLEATDLRKSTAHRAAYALEGNSLLHLPKKARERNETEDPNDMRII